MPKKLFFIFSFIFYITAFATENTPTFTSNKKPIIVSQKNPTFTITLQSNVSTGFSWTVKSYNKNLVTLVDHHTVAPRSQLMGAPGYDVWIFQAVKAQYAVNQVGHITLQYARPWTTAGASKKVFIIIVKK